MYSRDELVRELEKLHAMQGSSSSESEIEAQVSEMTSSILDPEWMDYLFQTDEFFDEGGSLKTGELADQILSYRPIVL